MNTKPAIQETGGNSQAGSPGEFRNLLADIEDLIAAATGSTGVDVAPARARLAERVYAARQSLEDAGSAVALRARRSAAATNAYVHERPWTAIGAGTAAGLLFGLGAGYWLARR